MTTQTDAILAHLRAGHEITPLEALERFGCMRLAARIADLRGAGHDIETRDVSRNGKTFAAYRLKTPIQAELFQIQGVRA